MAQTKQSIHSWNKIYWPRQNIIRNLNRLMTWCICAQIRGAYRSDVHSLEQMNYTLMLRQLLLIVKENAISTKRRRNQALFKICCLISLVHEVPQPTQEHNPHRKGQMTQLITCKRWPVNHLPKGKMKRTSLMSVRKWQLQVIKKLQLSKRVTIQNVISV